MNFKIKRKRKKTLFHGMNNELTVSHLGLHSKWSILYIMDHILILHLLRVIFFGLPYTCVMYGIRQCKRRFSGAEISAFFTKIFFQISVVILNSTPLHSQIFEFDINSSKKVLQFKFDWSYLSYYHIFFIIIGIIKKLV